MPKSPNDLTHQIFEANSEYMNFNNLIVVINLNLLFIISMLFELGSPEVRYVTF